MFWWCSITLGLLALLIVVLVPETSFRRSSSPSHEASIEDDLKVNKKESFEDDNKERRFEFNSDHASRDITTSSSPPNCSYITTFRLFKRRYSAAPL